MTADTLGGVWSYALELIRSLEPSGTEIVLMTMGEPLSSEQRRQARALGNLEVKETAYRLEWMDEPWADVDAAGQCLLELEAEYRPDVIHLNGYVHAALPWAAPVLVVAHSCVCSWWQAVHGTEAPARYDVYRWRVGEGLRAASAVVAPTSSMLAAIGRHYGAVERGSVVFNGIDGPRFFPGIKEAFVLAAGRAWDQAKNFEVLDRVAQRLEWPVWIAGESKAPDGRQQPFQHACSLGALPPSTLAGNLSRAAIYALPARYEPFGLSALEAGLSGCALVLGDIGSLREIWGDAALYASPSDEMSVAEKIQSLVEAPELLAQMGARARERALRYSADRMARGYMAVYRELLANKGEVAR